MKFKVIEVILTDNEGYLALKGLLPEGSILWSRSIGKEVVVCLSPDINAEYLEKNLNSIYRTVEI